MSITLRKPSDIVDVVRVEMVRGLVGRQITCAVTGEVLDYRTCVVLVDPQTGDPVNVVSQAGWKAQTPESIGKLAALGAVPDTSTIRDSTAVDYDGNALAVDPTCALCQHREYPHEH